MSETKPHPAVGDNTRPRKKTWLIIFTILIVIGAVILLIFAWWWFIQPAFVINGHKYTKSTYFKMMSEAKKDGFNQKAATELYIQTEKERIVAAQMNIEPTAQNFSQWTQQLFKSTDYLKLNEWQRVRVYHSSIPDALIFAKIGGYSGAYFNFPFTQHNAVLGISYQGKPKPEGYRDPQQVEADRKYAEEKANYYHTKIQEGMSVVQALAEINADPKLDKLQSDNGSSLFEINQGYAQLLAQGIVRSWQTKLPENFLQGEKTLGLSPVFTGKTQLYDLPGQPYVDANYYFVKIEKFLKPNPNIQKQFDDKMVNLQVEKHV